MTKTAYRHLFLGLGLAVALVLVVPTPSEACMEASCDPCWAAGCSGCTVSGSSVTCTNCTGGIDYLVPEGPRTEVLFLTDTHVRVKVQGYDTTHFSPRTTCVTAFPPLESVLSVDSVVNYNSLTGRPFEEVEFYAEPGPGQAVALLAEEEGVGSAEQSWHTYRSNITGTVEDGQPNYFVIELTLREGTDPHDFMRQLEASGSFLTSGSDEQGIPNHHSFFRQFGAGPMTAGVAYRFQPEAPVPPVPGGTAAEF